MLWDSYTDMEFVAGAIFRRVLSDDEIAMVTQELAP